MAQADVVVLGGGIGGYSAALRASQLGLRAAIVEQDKVGGTCLHRGCIPTKVLLHAAEALSLLREGASIGVEADNPRLNYSQVLRHQQEVVGEMHRGLRGLLEQRHGIAILQGRGRFLAPGRIAVGEEQVLEAPYAVIATGSRPREIPGLPTDGHTVINSDQALSLETLPASVIVLGGGAVGVEFASAYLDFGLAVTLVEMLPRLLPQEEPEIGQALARIFQGRGARVLTGARLLPETARLADGGIEVQAEGPEGPTALKAEKLLVAVGRQGNADGLGLERLKVRLEGSVVRVDGHMRTEEPKVFAVGDVTGGLLLAHVAATEGIVAAEAIAGQPGEAIDYDRAPRCVYCRPQVGTLGLTEEEAKARGLLVRSARFPLRSNSSALIAGQREGFVKVVSDAERGNLLGVHILGPQATELISQGALARFLGATVQGLGRTIHPHPSLAEALGEAALMAADLSAYSPRRRG